MRPLRYIKYKWQKLTRGFSDEDLWSLDHTLCVWLLPRLKEFQKFNRKYVGEQEYKDGDWHDIVDEMIDAVDFTANEDKYFSELSPDEFSIRARRREEGLRLLGEYMRALWC